MKTQKHLTLWVTAMLIAITSLSYAQGKSNDNAKGKEKKEMHVNAQKEKAIEKARAHKEKMQDKKVQIKENQNASVNAIKDNEGKGHAYGKNKGNLSGRDFGQQRAAEAKSKVKIKKEEVSLENKRLDDLKKKLEQYKSANTKISPEKATQISKAEAAINKAEEKLSSFKDLVILKEKQLDELLK